MNFSDYFNLFSITQSFRPIAESGNYLFQFFKCLTILIGMVFNRDIIDCKRVLPGFDPILRAYLLFLTLITLLTLLPGSSRYTVPINLFMTVSILLSVYASIRSFSRGYRPAGYHIVSSVLYLVCIISFQASMFAYLPLTVITANLLKLGTMGSLILYALSVADSYNVKITSDLKARVLAEEKLNQLNIFLEDKVQEKTSQLLEATSRASLSEMASSAVGVLVAPLESVRRTTEQLIHEQLSLSYDTFDEGLSSVFKTIDKVFSITRSLQYYSTQINQDEYLPEAINPLIQECVDGCTTIFAMPVVLRVSDDAVNTKLLCNKVHILSLLTTLLESRAAVLENQQEPSVNVSISAHEQYLHIRISDRGEPIKNETRLSILQPFHESSRLLKGTGLKLALIKDVLEKHKGHISFGREDEEKKYELTFPLAI